MLYWVLLFACMFSYVLDNAMELLARDVHKNIASYVIGADDLRILRRFDEAGSIGSIDTWSCNKALSKIGYAQSNELVKRGMKLSDWMLLSSDEIHVYKKAYKEKKQEHLVYLDEAISKIELIDVSVPFTNAEMHTFAHIPCEVLQPIDLKKKIYVSQTFDIGLYVHGISSFARACIRRDAYGCLSMIAGVARKILINPHYILDCEGECTEIIETCTESDW